MNNSTPCPYPRNSRYGRRMEEVEYADFCDNLGMHLGGYFLVMQRFAAYFKREGGGNMINVSSIYGVVAPRFEVYEGTPMTMPVEYAAIKSGLLHLTRYFAQYLIFRLPGVFGKWCKPNYNSVVATFCHNKAHDLPVQINDANARIGPRQQGRLRAPSVVHCGESAAEIRQALETALSADHRAIAARRESPYGRPGAARRIVDLLAAVDLTARAKPFVDRRCAADA